MTIPVGCSLGNRAEEFVSCLEASPLKCQRAQSFPPWLDQVEPEGIGGLKLARDIGLGTKRSPWTRRIVQPSQSLKPRLLPGAARDELIW